MKKITVNLEFDVFDVFVSLGMYIIHIIVTILSNWHVKVITM